SLNVVDPAPATFQSFAGGDAATLNGRAFVAPLTYTVDPAKPRLRGLGRCPTLSSLVLVVYVSGFGFKDGTHLDFDETPDEDGSIWKAHFAVGAPANWWPLVTSARLRAFVVPTMFD